MSDTFSTVWYKQSEVVILLGLVMLALTIIYNNYTNKKK